MASLPDPMPVAEMKVTRVGTLREAVHLRAIGLVEVGETKGAVAEKPSVNGTTVYLWWNCFCDENRWQTINAPVGRVVLKQNCLHQNCPQVCFAATFCCFGIGHDQDCIKFHQRLIKIQLRHWIFIFASAVSPISLRSYLHCQHL